jgi:hypothetical protein
VPVVRVMSAGASDGAFLRNAGIPAYGHSGLAADIDDERAHGKDERVAHERKSFFAKRSIVSWIAGAACCRDSARRRWSDAKGLLAKSLAHLASIKCEPRPANFTFARFETLE